MAHIPVRSAVRILWQGIRAYASGTPLVVSFETTLSCNANCTHCDLGGGIPDEKRLAPAEFTRYMRKYRPPVVQLSGGEPLLRSDLLEVIKAVKITPQYPYIILVSNAWLMTDDKYTRFRQEGVNQFSISLDFPDSRHDDFRHIPGLFARLEEVLPRLASHGHGDIILNTAITSANARELPAIVDTARRWGVCISFSVYTPLRTNNPALCVTQPEDIALVEDVFRQAKVRSGRFRSVVNPARNLDSILQFIRNGDVPNCSAGKRFLVVRPDGLLNPCSLHRVNFVAQSEMIEEFSRANTCGACNVSIRSYVEASLPSLLWETISGRLRQQFRPAQT